MTGGDLTGTTSEDVRINEERTEKDELAQFYNKYYESDLDGSPKIPEYEKLGWFFKSSNGARAQREQRHQLPLDGAIFLKT